MADLIPTAEDIDKVLDAPDQGIPISGSGGISSGTSTPSQPSAPGTSPVPAARTFSTGTTFGDVGRRLETIGGDIGGVKESFYSDAGPRRVFGSGEEEILTGAAFGTGSMDDALGLTGAGYTGPAGLDEAQLAPLGSELSEIRAFSDPVSKGRNLSVWAQQATPGLTPGEARRNVEEYYPEQMQMAADAFRQAGLLGREIGDERTRASAFATDRMADEEAIRAASLGFVEEQQGTLMGDLGARAEAENERARAIQAAYQTLLDTGDTSAISQYAPEVAGLDLSAREREGEAGRVFDKVMQNSRYDSIKDIEPGKLVIDTDGIPRVHITVGGQDYNTYRLKRGGERIPGMSLEESMSVGRLAEHRQAELERWFSPVTGRTQNILNKAGTGEGEAIGAYGDWFADRGYRGEYADVRPLYTEELGYKPPPQFGIDSYVNLREAPESTAQSVASVDEALAAQRMLELLGSGEQFVRRESPTAGITADVEGFNTAEAGRYGGVMDALREAERARRAEVTGARQQYVDEKNDWRGDLLQGLSYIPILNVPSTIAGAAGAKGGRRVRVPGLPDYEYERRF